MCTKQAIALALLFVGSGAAQGTPDGITPANEGICDSLQGGTPSLFGLCTAFCEAQDFADPNQPITQEQIDQWEEERGSAKTLTKYNQRKQPGDPDMPCVVVQEACPCWTEVELALQTPTDTTAYSCSLYPPKIVGVRQDGTVFSAAVTSKRGNGCVWRDTSSPGGIDFRSQAITEEEATACATSIANHCAAYPFP